MDPKDAYRLDAATKEKRLQDLRQRFEAATPSTPAPPESSFDGASWLAVAGVVMVAIIGLCYVL